MAFAQDNPGNYGLRFASPELSRRKQAGMMLPPTAKPDSAGAPSTILPLPETAGIV
jgi:hypothetical protein